MSPTGAAFVLAAGATRGRKEDVELSPSSGTMKKSRISSRASEGTTLLTINLLVGA